MSTAEPSLESVWSIATEPLAAILLSEQLDSHLVQAFGSDIALKTAADLLQGLINDRDRPPIELLPTAEMNGANGAFSVTTGKVYLATELVSSGDVAAIAAILLEELGHHLDAQLNAADSPGDEGALFAALVTQTPLTSQQIEQLQTASDQATIPLAGATVLIEQNADGPTGPALANEDPNPSDAADDLDDLFALINGLDVLLPALQDVINNQIYAISLPLIGTVLETTVNPTVELLTDLQARLVEALRGLTVAGEFTADAVAEILAQSLLATEAGLTVLGDLNLDSIIDAQDIAVTETADDLNYRFLIDVSQTFDAAIAPDLGLPGLGLNILDGVDESYLPEVTLDYQLELNFGVNDAGFYVDTSSADELQIGIEANLPELDATANLGFLQFHLSNQDDPSGLSANFTADIQDSDSDSDEQITSAAEIYQLQLDPRLTVDAADVNLSLTTKLDPPNADPAEPPKFPTIGTDLSLDWAFGETAVDVNNPQRLGGNIAPNVSFENVTLDVGSYISNVASPVLDIVQSVLSPFDPIIEVLTQPINLGFTQFSLIELAEEAGIVDQSTVDFVDALDELSDLVDSLADYDGNLEIELGDFDFGGADIRDLAFDLSGVVPNFDANAVDLTLPENSFESSFVASAETIPGEGLLFPLLTDPQQTFNLLLGQSADLFVYDLPQFNFGIEQDITVPIVGPLLLRLGADVGAAVGISGFGYDTQGLQDFADGGFSDPSQIFNGFYVSDFENADGTGADIPEVSLTGGLEASAELNVGFGSTGAGGGLYAGVDFDLYNDVDANGNLSDTGDGRLRADEFASIFARDPFDPLCLFNLSGGLDARLFAYFRLGVGIFSFTRRIDSPNLNLLDFNYVCGNSPTPGSPLAVRNGNVLTLQTTGQDDGFVVAIAPDLPSNDTLRVTADGFREDYLAKNIDTIVANGQNGSDFVQVGAGVTAQAILSGNGGDDYLIGGDNDDTLSGNTGVDRLEGGLGDDTLDGGNNDDLLIGGPGKDTLDGGGGDDTASYITATAGVTANLTNPNNNEGDAQGDTYISIEQIEGSNQDDTLIGDGGKNSLIGLRGNDTLEGGAGQDILDGGPGDDILRGGEGKDTLAGGAGADFFQGGGQEDTVTYTDSTKGITLNLKNASLSTGHALGDTFDNIEIYEGSYYGDTFWGDKLDNTFIGLDGKDLFYGSAGDDTFDGGNGKQDTVSYVTSKIGLTVDLANPNASTGFAKDDRYFAIETFQGSNLDDVLVGGDQTVTLDGLEGNNVLDGVSTINNTKTDATYDLRAGTGNDSYRLAFNRADGSIIRDRGGNNDELVLDGLTLDLARPNQAVNGKSGLARRDNDLIIDVDQNGDIDHDDDLTIENFFAPRDFSVNDVAIVEGDSGTQQATFAITAQAANGGAGIGFIERLGNLSGTEVIKLFNTVKVDYETVDGTATLADKDYQATSGTLTFAPNETQKLVTVNVKGNLETEPDEFFTLNLSSENGTIRDGSGRGEIINDDFEMTIANQLVVEGDSGVTIAEVMVSLSAPSDEAVTVDYVAQSQTALVNSDFLPASGQLLFAPSETAQIIPIAIVGDTENELDQTFDVQLSNASDGTIATDRATVTILDDDQPSLTIADVTVLEGNSGATIAAFAVTLSEAAAQMVSVAYTTQNDEAIAGLDYTPTSGVLTFQPGEVSQAIAVEVIGETQIETSERFYLNLSDPVNVTLADGQGVANIRNDDRLEIAINQIITTERDAGNEAQAIFTVELSDVHDEAVTVDYASADITATAGVDYTPVSGTLTFAPGETAQQIIVPIIGDDAIEANETYRITLSNPSAGIITTDTTLGTIRDNDYPAVAVTDVTLLEGDTGTTSATVTVSLATPGELPVTVSYATQDGSAIAGSDYLATQGQLTFQPGDLEQVITVPILGDTKVEPDEAFTVTFSNLRQGELANPAAEVVIINDDVVNIVIDDVEVPEWADAARLTVSLSQPSDSEVTVQYRTQDIDAQGGQDYAIATGTVTFAAGETERSLFIPLVDDAIPELDEPFVVELFAPSSNATLADDQGIVTILDNEPIAWWQLDEKVGTVAIDSAGDNDGQLFNAPSRINGQVNRGLDFDGLDDFVGVADDDELDFGTGDFALSTWVRFTTDNVGTLLDKRVEASGATRGYGLFHANGRIGFQLADGNDSVLYLGSETVLDGDWHHVVVSFDRDSPTGGQLYIDGVLDGSADLRSVQGSVSNDRNLAIGRRSDNPVPLFYDGALDEIKLFDQALTSNEVLALYLNDTSQPQPPTKLNGLESPTPATPADNLPRSATEAAQAAAATSDSQGRAIANLLPDNATTPAAPLNNPDVGGTSVSVPDGLPSTEIASSGASLSGQLWYDQNLDGVQEIGEQPLTGWTVFLDANANAVFDANERFALTDNTGRYTFETVTAGTYAVTGVPHRNWAQSQPTATFNSNFEAQTLGRWAAIGNYAIVPTAADAPYRLGAFQAEVSTATGAIPVDELETFLGLSGGSLDTAVAGLTAQFPDDGPLRTQVTEGSAIARQLTVEAGDRLTFDWNLGTFDYVNYMDSVLFTLSSEPAEVLATVLSPIEVSPANVFEETGLQTFAHTFTDSGTYTVGMAVVDAGDRAVSSFLSVDNIVLTQNDRIVEVTGNEAIGNLDFGYYLTNQPPTVEFSAAAYSVAESQPTVEVTLVRRGDTSSFSNVNLQLIDGTAQLGSDFEAINTVVGFAPGEVNKTVAIPLISDQLLEGDETFVVQLVENVNNSGGGGANSPKVPLPGGGELPVSNQPADIGAQDTALITVLEDQVSLEFSQPTYQIHEDGRVEGMAVTIVRTGNLSLGSEIELAFLDGTAIGGDPVLEVTQDATGETTVDLVFPDGTDFDRSRNPNPAPAVNTRTVVFEPGQTSQTLTVPVSSLAEDAAESVPFSRLPIHDDDLAEGQEFFTIELQNPSAGTLVGPQHRAEIEIIDNEGAAITGTVWHDLNANAAWNVGETGLSGWTVYIDANENQTLDPTETSTLTDANGVYSFTGLAAGTYAIAQMLPPDWQQTLPNPASQTDHTVTVTPGETASQRNFGNHNPTLGQIQGTVWSDRDQDGFQDDEESPLSGWTVYLDADNDGVLDQTETATVTDSQGRYRFSGLAPGAYTVRQVLQPNWRQTVPSGTTGNDFYSRVLAPSAAIAGRDFGNVSTDLPVAWWRLDEGKNADAIDSVGNNDGQLQNNPSRINGQVNGGLRFDGVDDFVNVPDDDALDFGTGDFAIALWFRFIDDDRGILLDKRIDAAGPDQGYVLYHLNGRLGFQMDDGLNQAQVQYLGDQFVADGDWHQVVISVDRDAPKGGQVFIDGQPVDSFDPTATPGSLSNNRDLRFGRRSNSADGGFYQGDLDEIQLFKAALTPDQVLALYSEAVGEVPSPDAVTGFQPTVSGNQDQLLGSPLTEPSATISSPNPEPLIDISDFSVSGMSTAAPNLLGNLGFGPVTVDPIAVGQPGLTIPGAIAGLEGDPDRPIITG